jgi:hypothetical protein
MVRVYLAFIVILSLFSVGCEDTDVGMALEAGADAVRKAIASQQNEVGDIARSAIGALTENLLNAQFSQQEERKADDFGVMFLKQKGHDIQPAISALMKLAALGGNHSFFVESSGTCETRKTFARKCFDTGTDRRPFALEPNCGLAEEPLAIHKMRKKNNE